jgi:hypothetical protein
MHERPLGEQWLHAILAPRHLLIKAAVVAGIVFCFLSPSMRAQVLNGAIYYGVVFLMVFIGLKMILGVFIPPKKKKKGDH